jgi:hypothetical protein
VNIKLLSYENNQITKSEGKEDIALKLVEKIWAN